MKKSLIITFCMLLIIGFSSPPGVAAEQSKEIKVGALYSVTGPFAPAGALRAYRGFKIAVDMINERGGVAGKYKIKPVIADGQSNPDIAIREAERLISVERVPIIIGVFSSSIAKPLAPICERNKTVFFITNAIADGILKDRHQHYVFRHNWTGTLAGQAATDFLYGNYKKLGYTSPSQFKVAVLHEDGPYGVSCAKKDLAQIEKYGMKLVFKEGYAHDIKDMSAIVGKLKASGQDVILHTGYFPDIVLLYRQGRELGLKTHAIVAHGAGYSDAKRLEESLGLSLFNYVFDTNSPSIRNFNREGLEPEASKVIDELLRRVKKEYNEDDPPTFYADGCVHSWIVFNEVMPLALKKYGEITADTLAKAFREIDVPPSRDPRNWGAKYAPPEHEIAGQNMRAMMTLLQRVDGKERVAWPERARTIEPKFPWPKGYVLAK